jgi:AMP nucleosidase
MTPARASRESQVPQMPAYHLKREDGDGITLVNIGVGPSNAKTITDHIAVLRPNCWLMLGHCAGLRRSQLLGDYVLAHGYVRDDHVLDQDLPSWVPVPPIAEVQVALQEATAKVTGLRGQDLKTRMRTGTVATTDNRNWELRFNELFGELNLSRAIAVDMESATVQANGFRFRVPYGTFLCVSDKPLHGELKLRGMANSFYRERISPHERRLSQNMVFHRLFELRLGWPMQIGQQCVQCVELEEISVPPDSWARPPITSTLPIIDSLQSPGRQLCRGYRFE